MDMLTVVNFHGIGTPARELEPGEAPYWISEDSFIRILDKIVAHPNRARIRLTFDDSNSSDHDIAAPLMRERDLTAEIFVLTGRIGQGGSLGVAEITALQTAGFAIGSHGINHVNWGDADPATLKDELHSSRATLEDICGHPIDTAAIPFGRYARHVITALHTHGYRAAYTSDLGQMRDGAFLRPRSSVRCDMTPDHIDAILDNRMPPLRRLRRQIGMARKRWL